ncbi:MAG: isoprenyl transferase [Eubacteriales bacterium]|nr:isoprenyl transferase [Eubacteriales bacterium]
MSLFNNIFGKTGKSITEIKGNIPKHIAIIPDGNGRWAKKRGLPRSVGHRAGSNSLKKIVIYCDKIGVKYLTIYTFSTENWSRPKEEVDALMSLLLEYLKNAEKELEGTNVRIRTIGDIEGLPNEFLTEIPRVEKMTKNNKGLNLVFALNYGGRAEILNAIKSILKDASDKKLKIEDIDEELFRRYLFTKAIPEPDLIIRTGGEMRTSNFLMWQSAYSEYIFPDILWPDFTEENMADAIKNYMKRHRRYGGI